VKVPGTRPGRGAPRPGRCHQPVRFQRRLDPARRGRLECLERGMPMTAPHANHPTAADLAAFAVGKLAEAGARAVAEHLAGCPDCRRAAEDASGDSFLARVRAAGAPGPSDNTAVPGGPAPAAAPPDLPPELANHPRYRISRELG